MFTVSKEVAANKLCCQDWQTELRKLWLQNIATTKNDVLTVESDYEIGARPISRLLFAKAGQKFCDCPNAEPGKIILDPLAHEIGCRFRKKIAGSTVDTSAIPDEIRDGYQLGVALH